MLSSLAVLVQYAVSALSLFRLAFRRERGFGVLDQWLSSLTLLSMAMLAQAAEPLEIVVLAGLLLGGFGLLYARRALSPASRPSPLEKASTRSLTSLDP